LLGSGLTFNYQLVGGVAADASLRKRVAPLVAATSSVALRDLPRLRGSSELFVPIAFGAVAVIYHLPALSAPLRLRGGVLAAIFRERITRWNDRRIAADNPGVRLPPTPITVVHRSDDATSTAMFTLYLAASSKSWLRGPGSGSAIDWPAGTAVSGDAGLRQVVAQTPGAIGYTDLATALQDKLATVRLRNPAGAYVAPTLRTTAAVGRQPHDPRNLSLSTINARVPGAYPIAAEAYMMTLRDLCDAGFSHPEATGVQRLLAYMLTDGQAVAREFSFAPLPPGLRASARREVRRMQCGSEGI
jgi:phosphate transport system substrate-binding protein